MGLSDFEAQNTTLQGDYFWQVVEIVIGGIPTVLKVHCICSCIFLGRILWQGSVLKNVICPMRHQVDIQNVEVGI
jgi:hypothetical protein